jgi:hypothetical protein
MNNWLSGNRVLRFAPVLLVLATPSLAMSAETPAAGTNVEGSRDYSLLDDRFMVSLGTFMLTSETKLAINGTGGNNGTEIDTEKDLGFRDADRFRLDATWRFAPKHKVRAMYFTVSQKNTRELENEITVGDTTYPVTAEVSANFSTKVYELAYEYAFMARDNFEITGSAGLHAIDFGFSISGQGTINGQPTQTVRTETASVTAPLPVFGLRGLWEIAPKWYLDAQFQYFTLEVDNIDGEVTDLRAGITWMFAKHWGLGAGYNRFVTDIGAERRAFTGDLKWTYSGAQVFITASY